MEFCILLRGLKKMQGESIQRRHTVGQASDTCSTHIRKESATLVLAPAPLWVEGRASAIRGEKQGMHFQNASVQMMLQRGFPEKIIPTPISSLTGVWEGRGFQTQVNSLKTKPGEPFTREPESARQQLSLLRWSL